MIEWKTGDLLDSHAEALVNTVNTVGVMGKGIALQFRERFPNNFKEYRKACEAGTLQPGRLLVVKDRHPDGREVHIVNFPTKKHWRNPSRYEYIEKGLKELILLQKEYGWRNVAVPPLGCGNGKLEWKRVKALLEKYLEPATCTYEVFQPNPEIKKQLQCKSPQDASDSLTPARAMLLYALFEYERRGGDATLFAANKMAWFLQRLGENLKLRFEPLHYGPYAHAIKHLLYKLNGTWLTGLEQKEIKPFEHIRLNYSKRSQLDKWMQTKLGPQQWQRLEALFQLLEGFENDYGLELLSTIDYIRKEAQEQELTLDEDLIVDRVKSWSSRKKHYLKENHIGIAWTHLNEFSNRSLKANFAPK